MRRRLVRRGAAMVAALAVGTAGAMGAVPTVAQADPVEATPLSVPGMAVSLAQAGELSQWGDNSHGQANLPASLAGVAISQVVLPDQAALALTADGRVVGWGNNLERLERVPAAVTAAKVVQIATMGGYAGAVTADGRVLMWGATRKVANPLNVPAGLTGVKQLALSEWAAAALLTDGSVVAWGLNLEGQTNVPPGLKATAIQATGNGTFFALTDAGSVTTWGYPPSGALPAAVLVPGNVKAIATGAVGGLALLADNTTALLDSSNLPSSSNEPWTAAEIARRAEFASREAVLLATGISNRQLAIVDRDRAVHVLAPTGGGPGEVAELPGEVPTALNGRALVQIVVGRGADAGQQIKTGAVVITKMLRAALPQVTGAVKVGSVLTGVPGTFSAQPDSVTSQWLVGGVPAGSGAQLMVTAAMVGKTISYQSTATKAGETTISSASDAVTVPAVAVPPPMKVTSKSKVAKVSVAKKAASVTVTGKVTASKSPAGKVKVTIKKGKKVIVTKTVAVSAKGALKLTVKKFAKLVAKKLKAKGKKAKTAYRGKYVVSIAYVGNAQVKASTGSGKFTIKK
jgi:hypothetical protein